MRAQTTLISGRRLAALVLGMVVLGLLSAVASPF
jgi:hypothetical protein